LAGRGAAAAARARFLKPDAADTASDRGEDDGDKTTLRGTLVLFFYKDTLLLWGCY
jgi:hypothetical protein